MKVIEFCGRSLVAIRAYPPVPKREAGFQLDRIQRGLDPIDWKPMASIGKGVKELRIKVEGEAMSYTHFKKRRGKHENKISKSQNKR